MSDNALEALVWLCFTVVALAYLGLAYKAKHWSFRHD